MKEQVTWKSEGGGFRSEGTAAVGGSVNRKEAQGWMRVCEGEVVGRGQGRGRGRMLGLLGLAPGPSGLEGRKGAGIQGEPRAHSFHGFVSCPLHTLPLRRHYEESPGQFGK